MMVRSVFLCCLLLLTVPAYAQEGTGTLVISAAEPTTKSAVVKVEVDMNRWGPGAVKELLGWALTFAVPTALGLWALYRSGQNRTAITNTATAAHDAATQQNGVTPKPEVNPASVEMLSNISKGGTGAGTGSGSGNPTDFGTGFGRP